MIWLQMGDKSSVIFSKSFLLQLSKSRSMKKIYSPSSLLEGRDSILLIFRPRFAMQFNAFSNAPGLFDLREKAMLALFPFVLILKKVS